MTSAVQVALQRGVDEHSACLLLLADAAAPRSPDEALPGLLAEAEQRLAGLGFAPSAVVRRTVFAGVEQDEAVAARLRQVLAAPEAGAAVPPPSTLVRQAPLGGGSTALELLAWAPVAGRGAITTGSIERASPDCCVAHGDGFTRAWVRAEQPLEPAEPLSMRRAGIRALEQAEAALAAGGAELADVVRAWFYIPEILRIAAGGQHYQQFNEARAEFYGRPRRRALLSGLLPPERASGAPCYPASTGIGVEAGPLVVELEALVADPRRSPPIRAVPVENPEQVPAFAYPGQVLVGPAAASTPRFSRGLVERQGREGVVRVSGTASIRGAATVSPGDVQAQTRTTLRMIEALLGPANLAPCGLRSGLPLADLGRLRVYVKRPADLPLVRSVCADLCPGVPALYLHADVCRDDLLVEIEAHGLVTDPP